MYREALANAARRAVGPCIGTTASAYSRGSAALGGKDIDGFLRAMGQSIGPPWQAKHKLAAAAALCVP